MHRPLALLASASLIVVACGGSDGVSPSGDETTRPDVAEPVDDEPDEDSAASGSTGADPDAAEPAEEPEPAVTAEPAEEPDPAVTAEPAEAPTVDAVSIEGSEYIGLAASVAVDLTADAPIRLSATSGDHTVETPVTAAVADRHELPLVGLRAEQTYDVTVHVLDPDGEEELEAAPAGTFTTEPLPFWFSDHEIDIIDPERMSSGFTIVEFDRVFAGDAPEEAPSNQYLAAFDDEGEIVWWYLNTGTLAGVEQTVDGTFFTHYWPFGVRETNVLGELVGHWVPQARATESDEVDAELAVEVVDPDQVDFTGGFDALRGNPGDMPATTFSVPWIEISGIHHEAVPMPDGNILALSITEHELTPEQRAALCPGDDRPFNAISDVVVEFTRDGTVVRTWDLWDAVDIDEIPGNQMCVDTGIFAGDGNRDWTHANSVVYDPVRDAIIVSSRHTDQIIAFDHLDDEGPQSQVRWILGRGATMPFEGEPTYYQHAVEVNPDGSLIIYDNGNWRPGGSPGDPVNPWYSRAVIYEVDDSSDDPSTWSARQRWEHVDLDEDGRPVFTAFIGDADLLPNGNVLINHGGIGSFPVDPANPLNVLVTEVVPSGESGGDLVWVLRSDPDTAYASYRSERIETFYRGPLWREG